MVSQQFLLADQGLNGIKEASQLRCITDISRLVAQLTINLSQRRRA